MYIYINTYMYTYIHIYTYTYKYIHIFIYTYMHTHTGISHLKWSTSKQLVLTHEPMNGPTPTDIHKYMQIYIHTYMYIYIHTYMYTYIHIYTYTSKQLVLTHEPMNEPTPTEFTKQAFRQQNCMHLNGPVSSSCSNFNTY